VCAQDAGAAAAAAAIPAAAAGGQQQPAALPPPPTQPRRSAPEAALSAQIRAADSLEQLQLLVASYDAPQHDSSSSSSQAAPRAGSGTPADVAQALTRLNGRHLSRLLSALNRLQPPPTHAAAAADGSASFWSFSRLVFSECLGQLPSLGPAELSTSLWAASKLAQPPPAPQLRQLLAQLSAPHVLVAANAQDISMALYAAASLAMQVDEQQLDTLLAAAARQLHAAAPQAVANTLWAVAMLQHRPGEDWLLRVDAHCCTCMQSSASSSWQQRQQQQQQQQQGSFTPLGLHQVLWAMAKLQWRPTQALQDAFWSASLGQLQHMTPHGTSGTLWAVASLALQPPQAWTAAWLHALAMQLRQERCGPQDVSNALWAVVRLGLRPEPTWVDAAMCASHALLPAAGTQVRRGQAHTGCAHRSISVELLT
jgi:hypothetical protein